LNALRHETKATSEPWVGFGDQCDTIVESVDVKGTRGGFFEDYGESGGGGGVRSIKKETEFYRERDRVKSRERN
jgi:hypothetical protein